MTGHLPLSTSHRRETHWARGGTCLISLTPHGHPAGRDWEQVYENIEEILSEEGMPELRCRGEEALGMQGGEGHSPGRMEGWSQVRNGVGRPGLGVYGVAETVRGGKSR